MARLQMMVWHRNMPYMREGADRVTRSTDAETQVFGVLLH